MKFRAFFESQARVAAGSPMLDVELEHPGTELTREQILRCIAAQSESELTNFLLDQAGQVRPTVLVFHNDALLAHDAKVGLTEQSELIVTSLISGG